jgi:zinc transport system substrate-binding protein
MRIIPDQCYAVAMPVASLRHRAIVLVALVPIASSAACSSDPDSSTAATSTDDAITVAAAFYPLEEVASRVGGDAVEVVGLTPAGTGPHDLELTSDRAAALEESDVVVYIGGGFQPSVERALESLDDDVTLIDVLDVVDVLPVTPQLEGTVGEVDGEVLDGDIDPHVWVDPVRMIPIAEAIAAALDDRAADGPFTANAAAFAEEMTQLDAEFAAALPDCESRTLVTSHRAFEYLAQAHDLDQVSIAGISPDAEPDPQSLAAVAERARQDGVTTIFFEEQVPQELVDVVASEIGADTSALDPIETITQDRLDDGVTYAGIQRENLAALAAGLRCT